MALPKNKEVKIIIEKDISRRFSNVMKLETRPFNESPNIVQHEGKVLIHNTLDNQETQKVMRYKKAEVTYKLDRQKLATMTPEEVIALVDEKAKDMGGQMAKHHFRILNDTIKETGNSVDAKDQKLTPELFLEAMRKISITFDKDGNPKLPTIVISDKMSEAWKRVIKEAEEDPHHKEKFDKIIEQKRKEYNAEQASRKLVD